MVAGATDCLKKIKNQNLKIKNSIGLTPNQAHYATA
jgi:hypothetical protein